MPLGLASRSSQQCSDVYHFSTRFGQWKKGLGHPREPLCRCIACRVEDLVRLVIKPINDEKDRFLLFHIRREQYANRHLWLLRLLCRLHQLRIFVSICCQTFYRLISCGLPIPIEHCFRERFTSSQPNSKAAALALSLFSVSSVSGIRDLYQANFSVLSVPCRTHPLSHVIIQYRRDYAPGQFPYSLLRSDSLFGSTCVALMSAASQVNNLSTSPPSSRTKWENTS